MGMNLGLNALARFLAGNWQSAKVRKRPPQGSAGSSAGVEALENRELLTVYTVTTAQDETSDRTVLSLRDAVIAANADPGQDTITFNPSLNGARFFLTQGELQITAPVKILGSGAFNTVIDGQQASRVFSVLNTAGDVTFDSLTVTGGMTTADNASGAGIYSNSAGMLTLAHGIVTSNFTTGLYSQGGGIFSFNGPVSVIDSTVSGNGTTGAYSPGGGIATNAGAVTVIDSSIRGNVNTAPSSVGGGVATYSGRLNFTNSSVAENSTAGPYAQGGGIYSYSGLVYLTGTSVSNNGTTGGSAPGGGIATHSGPVTLVNSTVSNNVNRGINSPGGGISTYNGNLRLTNATVAFNSTTGTTSAGGGIFSGSNKADQTNTITLNNSIVADNNSASSKSADLSQGAGITALIANSSLIGVNTGTGLVPAPLGHPDANGNLIGTAEAPVDPQLSTISTTVGMVKTHALLKTSPAIDAGNNSLAVTPGNVTLPLDQAGQIRIFHSTVDMGAYELQSVAAIPTVAFDVSTQSAGEAEGITTLVVKLSAASSGNVSVPFTVSGTATSLTDFSVSTSVLVIPAGQTSGLISVALVNDTDEEGIETVIVKLGTPTNATLGGIDTDTLTITEENTGTPDNITLSANAVVENLANAAVGTLTTPDSNSTNATKFSIQPGGQGSAFTIVGNKLKVGDKGLNYEALADGTAVVNIRSTDSHGLVQDKLFKISVGDVNEAPVIAAGQTLRIQAGAPVGAVLGTIAATDPDTQTPNNKLTYSIIGGNTGTAFAIDPATGKITLATASGLAAATIPNFTLRVRVIDGGNPLQAATENITVKSVTPFNLKLSGRVGTISTKLNSVTVLDESATLANVDPAANLAQAKLTVSEITGGSDRDTLFVKAGGRVTVKGTSITVDGTVVATTAGGLAGKALVVTFTAGSQDVVNAVLGQIAARTVKSTVKSTGTPQRRTIKFDVTVGTFVSSATMGANVV